MEGLDLGQTSNPKKKMDVLKINDDDDDDDYNIIFEPLFYSLIYYLDLWIGYYNYYEKIIFSYFKNQIKIIKYFRALN